MFRYVDGRLHCEDVDMAEIGRAVGTPCYIYSSRSILDAYLAYDGSFDGVPHIICYAVKANSSSRWGSTRLRDAAFDTHQAFLRCRPDKRPDDIGVCARVPAVRATPKPDLMNEGLTRAEFSTCSAPARFRTIEGED